MNVEEIEAKISNEVLKENSEEIQNTDPEKKDPAKIEDEFEEDFKDFNQHKTQHKIEVAKVEDENRDIFSDDNEISTADEFKLQFFLGLIFSLLDGVHVILYRMFTKYKLEKEDIALDDDDKAGLEMYFKTKRVMALINKLPGEIIGIVHIEYIYMQKFAAFTKAQKALPENAEEEEEEEEEEKEEKKEPVKKRTYKKRKKRKPAKKAAAKKAEAEK